MSNQKTNHPGFVHVSLDRLQGNTKLPFAIYIYMPEKDKMLLFRGKDQVLEQAKLESIRDFADRFFIKIEDEALLSSTSSSKKTLEKIEQVIKTPRKQLDRGTKEEMRLKSAVLLAKHLSIKLDPNSSESPVEQANKQIHKIANEVFDILEVDSGLLDKIRNLQNSMGKEQWNSALNVATISALLACTIGYTDQKLIRDIATGGFLHDVGLVLCNLPLPLRILQYNEEEMERYKQHPIAGLELIETLGLEITEEAKLIVYQHEEKYEGGGFPMNLSGGEIFEPAQLVAIAQRLNTLIKVDEPGWLTPDKAFEQILDENVAPGKKADFNPILLQQMYEAGTKAGVLKI